MDNKFENLTEEQKEYFIKEAQNRLLAAATTNNSNENVLLLNRKKKKIMNQVEKQYEELFDKKLTERYGELYKFVAKHKALVNHLFKLIAGRPNLNATQTIKTDSELELYKTISDGLYNFIEELYLNEKDNVH